MTLNYDKFAWTPMYCGVCGRRFWLEPYKTYQEIVFLNRVESVKCKYCAKKEKEDAGRT